MRKPVSLIFEKPKEERKYFFCIDCKKRERIRSFFCNECFKKPFLIRLKIFQKYQLEKGFNTIDSYCIKQTHEGRLK